MDKITHHNVSIPHGKTNSIVSIGNENFNNEELMILKALPKRGRADISDLSGRTLYPPSKIKGAVMKLEHYGVIRPVGISIEDTGRNKTLRVLRNRHVRIGRLNRKKRRALKESRDKLIKVVELNYELSEKGKQIKNIVDKIEL